MNGEENQYLQLLGKILSEGATRSDRTGVGTKSLFGTQMRFSLANNIVPAMTTKKLFIRGVVEELLFFLRGDTDTKKLEVKGINIWKGNTTREFLDARGLNHLPEGDMGKGYGYQWRKFGQEDPTTYDEYGNNNSIAGVDQLSQVINQLKNDPYSRRIIMTAWNPQQLSEIALPPCHCFMQFYVDNNKLSCQFYQRTVDTFLGLPFNLLSYALLTRILAHTVGMEAQELIFVGGDTHLYLNHLPQATEQISREPYAFPALEITKKLSTIQDIEALQFEDFKFSEYKSHPAIKAEMAV